MKLTRCNICEKDVVDALHEDHQTWCVTLDPEDRTEENGRKWILR